MEVPGAIAPMPLKILPFVAFSRAIAADESNSIT